MSIDNLTHRAVSSQVRTHAIESTPAVKWFRLICEAEDLQIRTEFNLFTTWSWINQGNYAAARKSLDEMTAFARETHPRVMQNA